MLVIGTPHCTSYEHNERSILNYEGEITSKDRHGREPISLENDADDLFNVGIVTADKWEATVGANILSCFTHEDQNDKWNYADDDVFATDLSRKAECSKMSGSIGSTITDDTSCPLFYDPSTTTLDAIKESLSPLFNDEEVKAVLSSISVYQPKVTSASALSNLWLIDEKLADGAIKQTTQLCRHKSDNLLSRNFSTNDRMLRY